MKTIIKILITITVLVGVFLGGWFLSINLNKEVCPDLICPKDEIINNEEVKEDVNKEEIIENFFDTFLLFDSVAYEEELGTNLYKIGVSVLGEKDYNYKNCENCFLFVDFNKINLSDYTNNRKIIIKQWNELGLISKGLSVIKINNNYYLEFDTVFADNMVGITIKNRMDLETGEIKIIWREVCMPTIYEDETMGEVKCTKENY